jgi:hypothetical protein
LWRSQRVLGPWMVEPPIGAKKFQHPARAKKLCDAPEVGLKPFKAGFILYVTDMLTVYDLVGQAGIMNPHAVIDSTIYALRLRANALESAKNLQKVSKNAKKNYEARFTATKTFMHCQWPGMIFQLMVPANGRSFLPIHSVRLLI